MDDNTAVLLEEREEVEQAKTKSDRKPDFEFEPKPVYTAVKRVFDFVSSLVMSILLFLPILAISIAIIIKSPGNPIYAQKRVGKKGKDIRVYKFRSMKRNADHLRLYLTYEQVQQYKKEYKLDEDPRLIGYNEVGDGATCFGAKLRKSSIDELVQIPLNILIKGNMSVVGPRPILRSELEKYYTPEEQELILSVKPGLTGYWQAYARNDVKYETGERQKMELYYIKHRSLGFDLKIIFKTIASVAKKNGAK